MLFLKKVLSTIVFASTLTIFNVAYIFSMQQIQANQAEITHALDNVANQVRILMEGTNYSVHRANESMALAHSANGTAIRAFEEATRTLNRAREFEASLEQTTVRHTQLEQRVENATAQLENEFTRIIENAQRNENNRSLNERIQIEQARVNTLQQLGIFEQNDRIQAQAAVQASVDTAKIKWEKIQQIIGDPKNIALFVVATLVIALGIYAFKYCIPVLIEHLKRPHVIIETSEDEDAQDAQLRINNDQLIFSPVLKKQLFELTCRVQSAKIYNENLPNVLFYGDSGVGKTDCVKMLAHFSGLDYALTSGSEFAKITDLNNATAELRKLLTWAQKSKNGLIIYIDEAESLFTNRILSTTPKIALDFINTFLTLVSDKSQKNFMFIFATNHPFKLDDAVLDRIGTQIEFTLPETTERAAILIMYLKKFAQENKEAVVDICPEVIQALPLYADQLKGLSPRAIKFVAEEMIVKGRRQRFKKLTHDIALTALESAKSNLQKIKQWKQKHG